MDFGGFEVEQLESKGLGDAGGGVQLTGQFTASGFTFPVSFALQFVRVDRALVAVVTSGVGPDEPTADRAALLQVLVDGVGDQSAEPHRPTTQREIGRSVLALERYSRRG